MYEVGHCLRLYNFSLHNTINHPVQIIHINLKQILQPTNLMRLDLQILATLLACYSLISFTLCPKLSMGEVSVLLHLLKAYVHPHFPLCFSQLPSYLKFQHDTLLLTSKYFSSLR